LVCRSTAGKQRRWNDLRLHHRKFRESKKDPEQSAGAHRAVRRPWANSRGVDRGSRRNCSGTSRIARHDTAQSKIFSVETAIEFLRCLPSARPNRLRHSPGVMVGRLPISTDLTNALT